MGPINLVSVVKRREAEVANRPRCLHAKTMTSCFVSHMYINHCELLKKQLVLHLMKILGLMEL
jgi:hypothetical protein